MEYDWLISEELIKEKSLKKLIYVEKRIKKVRRGCFNTPALLDYRTIPPKLRAEIEKKIGANPFDVVKKVQPTQIEIDYKAFEFFSNYRYPDGSPIPTHKQDNILLWANNACVLNALISDLEKHTRARAAHGKKPMLTNFYKSAVKMVASSGVQAEFENNLPTNDRRLREKLEQYRAEGYECLVKKYVGNQNSRKVFDKLEMLILSLYAMPNKPFSKSVWEMYNEFLAGDQSIIDTGTGEIYEPSEFIHNGEPLTISEATVWNYINKPSNRVVVDRLRNDAKYFKDKHEPHHHRDKPNYTLSKISMDDRDLPNSDVKVYYSFDVASGCIIGQSYSKDKDMTLVVDCFRNMFSFLQEKNLPMPMEVEVEQHLMNQLDKTILAENGLFKYVRWCAPGNSQEKWAETGNRLKKLGKEKDAQEGIGRFYSRLEANRPKQVGEWGPDGMRIKERKRSYEQAVAEDLLSIERYNNEEHPLHKGRTRLQVLMENVNPAAANIDRAMITRMVGESTSTSIRRGQYVTVQYKKYTLPHPAMLRRLAPNNYAVDAYYLPATDGNIESVFIYQNGKLISECKKIENYNTAKAEWTETDEAAFTEQSKYVSQHRAMVKNGKQSISKLTTMPTEAETEPETVPVFTPKAKADDYEDYNDYDELNNALNDF